MFLAPVCSSKVVQPFNIQFDVSIYTSQITFMTILGCLWLRLQLGYLWMTIEVMKATGREI